MRKAIALFIILAGLCVSVWLFLSPRQDTRVLTLATTTSTENSGLLAYLHPDFEKTTGIEIKVIAKGTGASLQLARDGNADVLLVHAPDQEEEFMAEGFGVERRAVMYNDFRDCGAARRSSEYSGVGRFGGRVQEDL